MFSFITSLVPDSVIGAQVLKGLRWLSTVIGAALFTDLVHHGMTQSDAASISAAAGGLVLAVGSGLYSMWDAKNVGKKLDQTAMTTAQEVTSAIVANPNATSTIAITAQSGSPQALQQLLALAKSQ